MSFAESLKNGAFSMHLESDSKDDIMEEMVGLMVSQGRLPEKDRQAALDCLLEREGKMSTGMQYGVAMPHGKTTAVDHLVTAFALKKEGVDFESLDGEPSRIFVMTVSSANTTGPHIKYLSEMGRLLNSPGTRKKILEAQSIDEVVRILTE